jgi:NAD(P)-dependent dehydrogenase (short-subunit alcohol dehydrogenase family)
MANQHWTEADVPDLSGRTVLLTGANTGLGFRAARVLARRGAHVVLACRNLDKAQRAADQIGVGSDVVRLDLASQASVRTAADEIRGRFPKLDLLINNAGVMDIPYQRTDDAFELTLATNHLGPFALTGLLLDRLAPDARIVTLSSVAHQSGVINFDDLQSEQGYDPGQAYAQSKLANLLFTYELDRRLRAADSGVTAIACHPGVVRTDLFVNSSRQEKILLSPAMRIITFPVVQSVRKGALPTLRAATDPSAAGGQYYGPRRYVLGRALGTGYPVVVESNAPSHDEDVQGRFWQVSEQLTGVPYTSLG